MPKELDLAKVSLIKGIRAERSVTRDRINWIKAITLTLLDGPTAAPTDQRKNYSIVCAYVVLRPTLFRDQLGAYRKKHRIHSTWISRVEHDIADGRVSYVNGEFVRDEIPRKPLCTKHQKLFVALKSYLEYLSDGFGHLRPELVRRMMYVKHQNEAADNEQVFLDALQLPSDSEEACASFVSITTIKRLLRDHDM